MLAAAGPIATAAQDFETGGKVRVDFRELVNWLFAEEIGTGGYQVGDESALQLQIRPTYRVNKTEDDPLWNIKLDAKITFGVHQNLHRTSRKTRWNQDSKDCNFRPILGGHNCIQIAALRRDTMDLSREQRREPDATILCILRSIPFKFRP